MGDEERSEILAGLKELERVIYKGDDGESILGRLVKLEMRQKLMLQTMIGLLVVATPGLVTLLILGIRTWINGAT